MPLHAFGLTFPGPVGLAAGFDRDGRHLDSVHAWGFGFVELGTVTPAPRPGHNPGVAQLVCRLHATARDAAPTRVGVSLGVGPEVAPEHAWRDYAHGLTASWSCADFLVLNFSSEAARVLVHLRQRTCLLDLLDRVRQTCAGLSARSGRPTPVLLKWPVHASDVTSAVEMARHAAALGYEGMVTAFDVATSMSPWADWVPAACRAIVAAGGEGRVIAVGGVDRVERALALREAGAALVQMYRGFVDGGPELVAAVTRAWRADALRGSP